MSATSTVPAAVPSVLHSSVPSRYVVAVNSSRPPTTTKLAGSELVAPGLTSLSM
jgi:hypothetical protein